MRRLRITFAGPGGLAIGTGHIRLVPSRYAQLTHPSAPLSRGSLLQTCHAVVTQLSAAVPDGSLVHVDRVIAAVAGGQNGIVTREQLTALGVNRGAVASRIERGLLYPLHRGVFAWGHPPATSTSRGTAAVYACGDGAVLSRHLAAAEWGFRDVDERAVDVTIVGRRRVRQAGIRVHRTTLLTRADIRTLRGIPITSPARTLLELAPDITTRELEQAVERAQVDRLVTKHDLVSVVDRAAGRAGAQEVRAVIADAGFTRSQAERTLAGLLRRAGLPRPAFNAIVEGLEVDAVWRPERVVVEVDGHAFHAARAAFERDRRRDAALARAGYLVLRTTWRELTEQPFALIARIAEALARRRY